MVAFHPGSDSSEVSTHGESVFAALAETVLILVFHNISQSFK